MRLHDLKPKKKTRRKRVGRGGPHGTTAGRGTKGQSSRSGSGRRAGFEGGRSSLVQQLPKVRGKRRLKPVTSYGIVNLSDLSSVEESDVTPDSLRKAGIVSRRDKFVKVLANGKLDKKLNVSAHAFSASAKEAIEKAGGKAIIVPMPQKKGAKPKDQR